jgi:hypothetical protein
MYTCHRKFNGGTLIVTGICGTEIGFMELIDRYVQLLNQNQVFGTIEVSLEKLNQTFGSSLKSSA